MFTFNYDLQVLTDLRAAMNENTFLAINKVNQYGPKKLNYQAWGRMCAAMDRIEDTVEHINTLTLGKEEYKLAFDFYEFINNCYVVIENLKAMADIFNADYSSVEKANTSFSKKCSDSKWFTYVRSLCSVHPTNTSGRRHESIMQDEVLGCCARVVWDSYHRHGTGDLMAIIYNFPQDQSEGKSVPDYTYDCVSLSILDFQKYLQLWLDFVPTIIAAIHKYNDAKYDEFRKLPIKKLTDCKNDLERIAVLRKEYNQRYGNNIDEIFDLYLDACSIYLSSEKNRLLLEKFKNAIMYSCQFLYNALQNMSFDGYENTGLVDDKSSFLFYELYYADSYKIDDFKDYGYHLSKLYLLHSISYFEKERIRHLLEEIKPIVNKYVVFTNSELEDETLILIQMAIYFAALESKCTLNRNIPNELKYRIRTLSQEEVEELLKEDEIEEHVYSLKDILPDDLKDLFE